LSTEALYPRTRAIFAAINPRSHQAEMGEALALYLAGAVLDDDVSVLADGPGLLRVGLGGAGVGLGLEVVLLRVRHVRESCSDPSNTRTAEAAARRRAEEY
jgi:hypothetical protein